MEKHPTPEIGTQGDVVFQRFAAFFLDTIIIAVLVAVLVGIGTVLGDTFALLMALLATAVAAGYKIVLEGVYGYTIGKMVLGLVVVESDGSNVGMVGSLIRNLLLIVDNLPGAYILGIALILLTDNNQRVGDLVADTIVVRQR